MTAAELARAFVRHWPSSAPPPAIAHLEAAACDVLDELDGARACLALPPWSGCPHLRSRLVATIEAE